MASQIDQIDETVKRKMAADFWKKGSEAMMKSNWDFAIKMFRDATKFFPGNLVYRQALRGCEEKKYNNNGTGATMSGMKLLSVRGRLKKLKMQKDVWAEIEAAAEDGLAVNPWDAQLNADLGEATRNLGHADVAIMAFERAVKGDPKSKDFNRVLGEMLEEKGEYARAIACYQRIMKIDPLDGVARSKITALEASSVMDRGGYDDAENTRDVMSDRDVAKRMNNKGQPQAADGPGMSFEADLQRAIRKEPANKDNYLKLADYYRRENKLEEAEQQLALALEASGGDVNIREQLEDVQLDRMRQAVGVSRELAVKSPDDPAAKQKALEMRNEMIKREIELLSSRIERYPANMRIKFDLACRFLDVKKHQMAIPLFQQARSDPRLKGESLLFLAKCFIADKEYSLARRQLEQAAPFVNFDEMPDRFKELHYLHGRVCEQLKDFEKAILAYQEVLAVDYTYKDTKTRSMALEGK